jgi:hypothetical protein
MSDTQFNIADASANWHASKCLTTVFSKFYALTNIAASVTFSFSPETENQSVINLSFSRTPDEKEIQIFSNLISNMDLLLTNYHMLNVLANYDNVKQLIFKLQEDTKQLAHKNLVYNNKI